MVKYTRQRSLAKPDAATRLRAYGREHLRSLIFSLGKLYRQPFATVLVLLMVAAALALPACLYILLNNLKSVTQKWDTSGQITLFLETTTPESAIKKLQQQLESHIEIETASYVSADAALHEFRERSQFGQLLDSLQDNPLPPTLILTPHAAVKNADRLDRLVQEFSAISEVEYVQLDMQWLQRLQAITDIIHHTIIVIGLLLGVSVLLVIGNSVRLDIENRREEIEVTKLIGATDRFIRRPFLYGGAWYGLLGGVLALLLVLIVLLLIKQPAQVLAGLYNSVFQLMFPSFKQSLGLVAASIALGLFGSWLAVGRHLARIEPR